jgi:hypothetical protein
MKKTVLLAATATLSAGLIGLAAVASASGPSSSGSDDVSPASSSTVELRHGADDPITHDAGDDHGSAGHRADDVPAVTPSAVPAPAPAPAPAPTAPAPAAPTPAAAPAPAAVPAPSAGGRNGADDPVTHDVGDDHGVDDPATHDVGDDRGHGADDPANHDAGDDHGGHHGADD